MSDDTVLAWVSYVFAEARVRLQHAPLIDLANSSKGFYPPDAEVSDFDDKRRQAFFRGKGLTTLGQVVGLKCWRIDPRALG